MKPSAQAITRGKCFEISDVPQNVIGFMDSNIRTLASAIQQVQSFLTCGRTSDKMFHCWAVNVLISPACNWFILGWIDPFKNQMCIWGSLLKNAAVPTFTGLTPPEPDKEGGQTTEGEAHFQTKQSLG